MSRSHRVYEAIESMHKAYHDAGKELLPDDPEETPGHHSNPDDPYFVDLLNTLLDERLAKCIKTITKKNVNVIVKPFTWSPLSWFLQCKGTDYPQFKTLFEHLIKVGADPNIKNDEGENSLDVAIGYYRDGEQYLITGLIKAGADKKNASKSYKKRMELDYLYKATGLKKTLKKGGCKYITSHFDKDE